MFIGDLAAFETYINGAFLWKYNLPALRHEKSELVIGYKSSKINCKSMGKDTENLMERHEKELEKEKRERETPPMAQAFQVVDGIRSDNVFYFCRNGYIHQVIGSWIYGTGYCMYTLISALSII